VEVLPDELGLVVVLPVLGLVVPVLGLVEVVPLEAPGSVVFDEVLVLPLVVGLVDVLVLPLVLGLRVLLVSRCFDHDEVSARPVCMRVVSRRLPITVSDRPGFPDTDWSSLLRAHAAPASTASDNAAIIAFLQSLPPM
jgi:hypothetical protein